MTLFLVDASHYQSTLPVSSLRGQGFVALLAKATQGSNWQDGSFTDFMRQAQQAGLLFAAYHYLEPGGYSAQAANTARVVPPSIPVWIDVEGGTTRDQAYLLAGELRGRGLTVAGIYNASQPGSAFGWWRAAYGIDPVGSASYCYAANGGDGSHSWAAGTTRHPQIWQFTQHGRVQGYSGDVDINAYRGTLAELVATGWFWVPDVLKGADLVLDDATDAQIRKAVREEVAGVLAGDIVPPGEYRPELTAKDPATGGQGIGPVLLAAARNSIDANGSLGRVTAQLGAITTTLAAIQAQQPDLSVDLPELARQIVAVLPDDLAKELADELARRLAS